MDLGEILEIGKVVSQLLLAISAVFATTKVAEMTRLVSKQTQKVKTTQSQKIENAPNQTIVNNNNFFRDQNVRQEAIDDLTTKYENLAKKVEKIDRSLPPPGG